MNRARTVMRKTRDFISNGYQENVPLSLPPGSSANLRDGSSPLETFLTMVLGTADPKLICVFTDITRHSNSVLSQSHGAGEHTTRG